MKARGGWREKPLPDEEKKDEPTQVVIYRWASMPSGDGYVERPNPAPKRIVRDIDHE